MNRIPVTSSNLVAVGYDPANAVLEIEFRGNAVYRYAQVPDSVYRALMRAESLGSYFHRHIRDHYRTTRIT